MHSPLLIEDLVFQFKLVFWTINSNEGTSYAGPTPIVLLKKTVKKICGFREAKLNVGFVYIHK